MNSVANPPDNRVAYVLARINAGLAEEWSRIAELAAALERQLKDARALGEPHIAAPRRAAWDKAWHDLRATFESVRASDAEAQRRFNSTDPSSDPLESWCDVLDREEDFSNKLAEIRTIGAESIPAADHSAWDDLSKAIEMRIATLEAHVMAVRFQLELRDKYGREKADALTREIAGRLPRDADMADAKKYAAQYRKASEEFEREKETFGGAWDVLKSLMLIQPKTPEERVRDKQRVRLATPVI